jgi:hypothetical protein
MKRLHRIFVGLVLFTAVPVWSQVNNAPAQPVPAMVGMDNTANQYDDRMQPPPAVSGQTYPISLTSQERSNYLRGGVAFTSAYSDNALGGSTGSPVSDVSYSIAPMVALDETTSRLHLLTTYAPGFTFYQRTSDRNQADHNASIEFEYRFSPHVTFSAIDDFQKSSNVFNQPDLASAGGVSGGTQGGNFSVIAPIANRLSNSGNVGITYQYALNSMVGASGTFTNLHYPDPSQVPGLSDASSQSGLAFYSLRVAKMNYLGVTYQYQRLVSYPTLGNSETQTHAVLFFYTLYPASRFSITFFGGPQHSDTIQPPQPPLNLQLPAARAWTPAAGASLAWQGRLNTLAASYSHVIAGGGGLIGAVQMDSAAASVQQRITKTLTGSVSGTYAQNDVLGTPILGASNGHSISGTASLQQQFGQHLSVQLGYTRLHQDYSGISVLASTPNTNREFVSLSYQFSRPLGR